MTTPLLAHLDRDGLGAPMRKALPHLPGFGGWPAQLKRAEPSALGSAAASVPVVGFLRVHISHAFCYRHPLPLGAAGREIVPASTVAPARNPASRDRSSSNRRHSEPRPIATWTMRSRPNAAPSSAPVNTVGRGRSRPSAASSASSAFRAVERGQSEAPPCRAAPPRRPGRTRRRPRQPGGQDRATSQTATRQQTLDAIGKLRRHRDRPPRRPREIRFATARSTISRRGDQPQTPSGQTRLDIGHDRPVRADDKAQQIAAIVRLAGDDAASPGRGGGLVRVIGLRRGIRRAVLSGGRRGYSFPARPPASAGSASASSNQPAAIRAP